MNDKELYTASELRDKFIASLTASASNITDFNPGSTIRAILDSIVFFVTFLQARIKKAYRRFMISTSEGQDLDDRVADWNITRVSAAQATTDIVFIRDSAATEDFTIAAGVRVSTQPDTLGNTIDFTLDEAITFPSGAIQVTGSVTCTQAGSVGNVASGTITNITSSIPGIDNVTNPNKVITGYDEETDAQLRARIPLAINGLKQATLTALEAAAYKVEGITFVKILPRVPANGSNTIYVSTQIGEVSDDLKIAVKEAIDEVSAFGIVNIIAVPTIDYITITIDVKIDTDNDYEFEELEEIIQDAVYNYVNLNNETSLYLSDINYIVRQIPGVSNVKNIKIDGVADDYSVADTYVIKLNASTDVTLTEI